MNRTVIPWSVTLGTRELRYDHVVDLDSEDPIALQIVSQEWELSGAQIKLSVLSALFLARQRGAPLGLAHLMSGIERELAKEGRGLSKRDRERVVHDGGG